MKLSVSHLDVRDGFGSWCQSRPKYVYYTLVSSKFMEIFVTLNVALVAVCNLVLEIIWCLSKFPGFKMRESDHPVFWGFSSTI
jgi:hypothetical protein